MEWLPGSLAKKVQHEGALSLHQTLCALSDVSRALAYIHSRGIAHNCLSAEDVLVDAWGSCKLADFGLARAEPGYDPRLSFDAENEGVLGIISWAAPENYDEGDVNYGKV